MPYVRLRISCERMGIDGLFGVEIEVLGQPRQSIETVQTCAASEQEAAVRGIVVHELEHTVLKNFL